MRKFTGDMLHTFFFTAYSGTITGADIVYKFDNKETNEAVKYFMTVKNDKIEKCRFQAFGSVVLYATATAISKMATGKSLLSAKDITEKDVIYELEEVNKQDFSKIVFALDSFKQAIINYQKKGKKKDSSGAKEKALYPAKGINIFDVEAVEKYNAQTLAKNDSYQVITATTMSTNKTDERFEASYSSFASNTNRVDEVVTNSTTSSKIVFDTINEDNTELIVTDKNAVVKPSKNGKSAKITAKVEKTPKKKTSKKKDTLKETSAEDNSKETVKKSLKSSSKTETTKKVSRAESAKTSKKVEEAPAEEPNSVQKLLMSNNKEKETKKKTSKKQKQEEESEMLIVPVGGKKKAKPVTEEKAKKTTTTTTKKVSAKKVSSKNVKPEETKVPEQEETKQIPTKIEVRVVDDEEPKDNVSTKKTTKKVVKKKVVKSEEIQDNKKNDSAIKSSDYLETPNQETEVIDEIDSITAKLTNAISELNFKFDDVE